MLPTTVNNRAVPDRAGFKQTRPTLIGLDLARPASLAAEAGLALDEIRPRPRPNPSPLATLSN